MAGQGILAKANKGGKRFVVQITCTISAIAVGLKGTLINTEFRNSKFEIRNSPA
jgi:hypothetical protein